jgi:hypothetical protein
MKKIFHLFGLVFLLIFPLAVSADVISSGYKSVRYCFRVENINDYPDYVFIAYFQNPMGGHKVINQNDCITFYKFSNPTIYAIKRNDFNEGEISPSQQVEIWQQEKNYFNTNTRLIASGINIRSTNTVKIYDPTQQIIDVFRIGELNNFSLTISPLKVIYKYADGTSEEKFYQTPLKNIDSTNRPEASRKPFLLGWFIGFWYIILPLAAITIFLTIIILRRIRR